MGKDYAVRPARVEEMSVTTDLRPGVQAALDRMRTDRAYGLGMLNALFRLGKPPRPLLDGRYDGEFLAIELPFGLRQMAELAFMRWKIWCGKQFNAYCYEGKNILLRQAAPLLWLLGPTYSHAQEDGPNTYLAYAFRTSLGAGREDPDCKVLKIDYNIPENPALTLRHLQDELVQLAPEFYLGKAHFRVGRWQRVAFFTLQKSSGEDYDPS